MARDPDVFISYSSDDLKDAETVCRVLELKGIRCWIASRDIPGGRHWDNAIVDGINASSLVVLIHTSNANGSDQIKKELHLAHEVQKIVIPLRVEKVHAEGELKYVLAGIQWVDAFEKPLEDQLEPLIERVREDLQASHPQPSAETAPRPAKSLRIALLYRRNVQPDDHVLA